MPFFKSKFMGLDITVYSKIKFDTHCEDVEPTEEQEEDENYINEYENKTVHLYAMEVFKLQNEGILTGGYDSDDKPDGFGAGSYSTYNQWRDELAKMVGLNTAELWNKPEKFKDFPFFELINFSDCESFIGPKTSAKLYQDFLKYDSIAEEFMKEIYLKNPSFSFKLRYDKWKKAFEKASDGGAVSFH